MNLINLNFIEFWPRLHTYRQSSKILHFSRPNLKLINVINYLTCQFSV